MEGGLTHFKVEATIMDKIMCGLSLALVALLLTACGGGGGSSSSGGASQPPPPTGVTGLWAGSASLQDMPSSVTGAILQNGPGFFFDSSGDIYILPTLTGSSTFSGTLSAFAVDPRDLPGGNPSYFFNVTGTVVEQAGTAINIQGNFTDPTYTTIGGTFSLTPDIPYPGTVSVAGLAGQWDGYYGVEDATSVVLNVNSQGIFTGNDADGCPLSGTLTQVQAGLNLYQITLTSSIPTTCHQNLTGLGFEGTSDILGEFGGAQGSYFYMGIANQSAPPFNSYPYVAEFKLQ
jgi:hypothetical protein